MEPFPLWYPLDCSGLRVVPPRLPPRLPVSCRGCGRHGSDTLFFVSSSLEDGHFGYNMGHEMKSWSTKHPRNKRERACPCRRHFALGYGRMIVYADPLASTTQHQQKPLIYGKKASFTSFLWLPSRNNNDIFEISAYERISNVYSLFAEIPFDTFSLPFYSMNL